MSGERHGQGGASWKQVIAGGVAAGLLFNGAYFLGESRGSESALSAAEFDTPDTLPEISSAVLMPPAPTMASPEAGRENCIEPTAEDMAVVDELLSKPKSPELLLDADDGSMKVSNEAWERRDSYLDAFAHERGLQVHEGWSVYQYLAEDFGSIETGKVPSPTDFYLETTNSFMQQLGVTVTMGSGNDYSFGGRGLTAEELENQNTKLTLMNIVNAYAGVTQEYIDAMGLKNIVLVTGMSTEGVAGYAIPNGPHDTFYINVDTSESALPFDVSGINHEGYHLLDGGQCGPSNMAVDPSFTSLNQGINIYSDITTQPYQESYSLEEYYKDVSAIQQHMYDAKLAGDVEGYCILAAADDELASQVVTYSDDHTNPAEEKAGLGSQLMNDYVINEVTNPRFPKLAAKAKFLLARLYHMEPAVVEYLIEQSSPQYQDPARELC